jgi:hypothetical protein
LPRRRATSPIVPGLILDIHDQHVAFAANSEPVVAQRRARGVRITDQNVDESFASLGRAADALDVDVRLAGCFAEIAKPARAILQDHREVLHRMPPSSGIEIASGIVRAQLVVND